jgi:S1-C subfamily serine protease
LVPGPTASVKNVRDPQKTIAGLPAGRAAELTVVRGGDRKSLSVTIAEQPKELGSLARWFPPG